MNSVLIRFPPIAVFAAVLLGFVTLDGQRPIVGPSAAFAQQPASPPVAAPTNRGYVIVLRGLMNIWSRGMDRLSEKLEAQGVRVHLDNHRHWKKIAADVAKRYQANPNTAPIVIIGHSLGANAAILMADKLGQSRVPVRLIIAFDGLSNRADVQAPISYNVQEVLNFYNSLLLGMEMVPGRGFSGTIENVDIRKVPGAGHIKIDKNPELQAQAILAVLKVIAEASGQSATN